MVGSVIHRCAQALRHRFFGTSFYGFLIRARKPQTLLLVPGALWPGEAGAARALMGHRLCWLGGTADFVDTPWEDGLPSDGRAVGHSFSWLGDLAADGSVDARDLARDLTGAWLEDHGCWTVEGWTPEAIAQRLVNWLAYLDFLASGAHDVLRQQILASAAIQLKHLRYCPRPLFGGHKSILVATGLIVGGLCLPDKKSTLEDGLSLLAAQLKAEILPDGGHVSRNPSQLLEYLRQAVALRNVLLSAHQEVPFVLMEAIDRMAPMLRTLRLGDKKLALFNGGREEEADDISALLKASRAKGKAFFEAPHTGFTRLEAGKTVILVDTGSPTPAFEAHAGTLSFELSVGKQRFFVNCGAHRGGDGALHRALRSTAAHTALSVDGQDTLRLSHAGHLVGEPPSVRVRQQRSEEGGIWLEGHHNGYETKYGIVHHRRLYLSENGEDFRGEDQLTGGGSCSFSLRFHLHPRIKASMLEDGKAVLLQAPDGAGWRLRAAGGKLSLAESIYLGSGDIARANEQVVVECTKEGDSALVKWALQKLS